MMRLDTAGHHGSGSRPVRRLVHDFWTSVQRAGSPRVTPNTLALPRPGTGREIPSASTCQSTHLSGDNDASCAPSGEAVSGDDEPSLDQTIAAGCQALQPTQHVCCHAVA